MVLGSSPRRPTNFADSDCLSPPPEKAASVATDAVPCRTRSGMASRVHACLQVGLARGPSVPTRPCASVGASVYTDAMTLSERRNFGRPDETKTFPHSTVDFLKVAGEVVRRFTLQPGWRWSQDIGPIAGTEWCESQHFQYQLSGHLHVLMADGAELELGAGDVSFLPKGHDTWVVGDEAVVLIDFYKASRLLKTWE